MESAQEKLEPTGGLGKLGGRPATSCYDDRKELGGELPAFVSLGKLREKLRWLAKSA